MDADELAKPLGFLVITLLLIVFIATINAIPTYYLWNWLSPRLFDGPTITFAQGWGVNCLTSLLFKSINVRHRE